MLSCVMYFCFLRATIKWKDAKYFLYMNDVLYFNFRPNAKCSVYPVRVNYSPIFLRFPRSFNDCFFIRWRNTHSSINRAHRILVLKFV